MPGSLDVYDALILTLRASDDVLFDRTAIQHLIYFESLKLQPLKTITYRNHFYGPFSHQVAAALDELVAFSYVNERIRSAYLPESHRYEIDEFGKNYANRAETEFSRQFEIISEIVAACNTHCKLRSKPLSYSAKAHYTLVCGGREEYTMDDVQRAAEKFEWEITVEDAKNGMGLLGELGLVSQAGFAM